MASFNHENNQLQRSMKSRHLFMIALGGVIGTGLFLGSGFTLNQAGPGGAVLAYLVGGFVMYLVMLCLGELAVAMPVAGSFQDYATRFIGPGTGFTIGWMYWLGWATTVGLELTSSGILMKRWFPDVSVWVWCVVFGTMLFLLNAFSARSFAETEFWFAGIKVVAILMFIILGGAAMFGLIDMKGSETAPMFSNFFSDGGLFPHGVLAVLLTMVTVNFSFQGTELIGIASGESESPDKTIPKAIRNTVWRTIVFFVAAIVVLAGLIPWKEAGVVESPFVVVFDKIGIPYAADLMNFVVLTALLSVANSGLYTTTRMLWALSRNGMASPALARVTAKGIPLNALIISLGVAGLSLLTSVFAEGTVYNWLLSISGMTAILAWMAIAASQFIFRKRFLQAGGDIRDLKFRTPLYPIVPILAFSLNAIALLSLIFIPEQRMALYCGIPFMLLCYLYYNLCVKKKLQKNDVNMKVYEDKDVVSM
ncbi:amino acid permease [Aneurinibacillus thermoaerophilus]|uniref:amino acid permease n=2 Tax=Aneurinibacillus thermoaerophilus TaxID=143495 RepID=UPI002E1B8BA9|nr:amino acid permease [Aneurinibacillus thermoaerophilus]MED0765902.1 amino acid permease [Aneurinibacillus thermoaerophilus]